MCWQILVKYQTWNFIKICLVGVALFHAERQTDGHEVISRFSQWLCELASNHYRCKYEGESNENLKYFFYFLPWTVWCADPWLISRCAAISFTVTRQFSFTMASTAAMASGVTTRCAWPGRGESLTELMPFMNFLVHSYTSCSDIYASPYWNFIHRWILMGFNPSLLKKRMTESCSSLVHVASGPPSLHYYCAVALQSCIVLPPVGHSSNHEYHCCQSTWQSSCVSNFHRTFKVFIWLSLVWFMNTVSVT